ncbi:MinD/ParA family protein [Smaragdicoccus niigatensis]|uniref:MinD/ParA family ATP-binding protein n=1 Tax=Smaragdicoccus niigatensis TaxID=359359 RepID=UPI00037A634F|nr:hypothetical protein [Smaragdicoccus niigatensis]
MSSSDTSDAQPEWMRESGLPPVTAVPDPRNAAIRISTGAPLPPPVLVLGGSGGSGSTTTAAGLGSVLASDGHAAVLVDATPAGGDAALRTSDESRGLASVQTWLASGEPYLPESIDQACGKSKSGMRVLGRGDEPFPGRETMVSVHRHLTAAGHVPVYDAGAPAQSRLIRPLLYDPRVPVVMTVSARADAANRLLPVLQWLDREFGEFVVRDCAIAVTAQAPDAADIASHLRKHLDGWVRTVVAVPYDPHLASGSLITWKELRAETRSAYADLLAALR